MTDFRYNSRISYRPFIFYLRSYLAVRYFSLTSVKTGKIFSEKAEDLAEDNHRNNNFSAGTKNIALALIMWIL